MSLPPTISIARDALAAIHAHAHRDAPRECCGLLLGRENWIQESWPAANIAGSPTVRYEIEPRDHFAAFRRARQAHFHILGAYHSHPRSLPMPSPTDLAEALPDFLYVIVGGERGRTWQARAFHLRDGNFATLSLVTVA
jgi:proteasome lid subunit RPN8/RPN11